MQDVRRSASESESDTTAAAAAAAAIVAPPAPTYGMTALNTLYSGLAPDAVRSSSTRNRCSITCAVKCCMSGAVDR
jgi:hypothetical protein